MRSGQVRHLNIDCQICSNGSSVLGAKAGGVPGEVRGYWEAKQRLGNPSISWAELVQPAIDICEGGEC